MLFLQAIKKPAEASLEQFDAPLQTALQRGKPFIGDPVTDHHIVFRLGTRALGLNINEVLGALSEHRISGVAPWLKCGPRRAAEDWLVLPFVLNAFGQRGVGLLRGQHLVRTFLASLVHRRSHAPRQNRHRYRRYQNSHVVPSLVSRDSSTEGRMQKAQRRAGL
ncbi:hypothetical protein AK972_3096 [Pseudomonas yamanorum]|nr:hypothetical protein AK972_3096 [Pseudomonas yamanorum]